MGIRKRIGKNGKVSYQAQLVKGHGIYGGSATFATKREARDWLADKRRDLERGWNVRDASTPMRYVVEDWEKELPGQVA